MSGRVGKCQAYPTDEKKFFYLINSNVCSINTYAKRKVQLGKDHMNTNGCGNKKRMVKGNKFISEVECNETELTRIKHEVVEIC